jgi:DnaJ-class molecular chaperone
MTVPGKSTMITQFGHFVRAHAARAHAHPGKGVRHRHRLSARPEHERRCPDCHDQGVVRARIDGTLRWTTCPTCGRSDQD